MGYTFFEGQFDITGEIDEKTKTILTQWAFGLRTPRVKLNVDALAKKHGITHAEALKNWGEDGELYFEDVEINASGFIQSVADRAWAVVPDDKAPPGTQPDLHCAWVCVQEENGDAYICWDTGENFYSWLPWLEYIVKRVLEPANLVLNGVVHFKDQHLNVTSGRIMVRDNRVSWTDDSEWSEDDCVRWGLQMKKKKKN